MIPGTKLALRNLFRFITKQIIGADLLLADLTDSLKDINRQIKLTIITGVHIFISCGYNC